MARRKPQVCDTRAKLLAAGIEAFAIKGYAASGVDDIVERAGTTRGAFYYYFASKQDMASDLQQSLWDAIAKQAQDALDPDVDIVTNIKKAFGAHLAAIGQLGLERAFLRQGFIDPALEAAGREKLEWGVALVREVLADALKRGEVSDLDPGETARLLTQIFEAATLRALGEDDSPLPMESVDALLDTLIPA